MMKLVIITFMTCVRYINYMQWLVYVVIESDFKYSIYLHADILM